MLRACHRDTCKPASPPSGPHLRANFTGTPEGVAAYFLFVAEEVRGYLAELGLRSLDEAIGRVDLLRQRAHRRPPGRRHRPRPAAGRRPRPTGPRHFVERVELQDPAVRPRRPAAGRRLPAGLGRRRRRPRLRDPQRRPRRRRRAVGRHRPRVRRAAAAGHRPGPAHRHRRARASAPSSPTASSSTSPARPTTTSARAWAAAGSSSARRDNDASELPIAGRQHLPVRRDRRRAVRGRRRRRAVRGAQLRRHGGGRGRGRPLLRVHDRRHGRRARPGRLQPRRGHDRRPGLRVRPRPRAADLPAQPRPGRRGAARHRRRSRSCAGWSSATPSSPGRRRSAMLLEHWAKAVDPRVARAAQGPGAPLRGKPGRPGRQRLRPVSGRSREPPEVREHRSTRSGVSNPSAASWERSVDRFGRRHGWERPAHTRVAATSPSSGSGWRAACSPPQRPAGPRGDRHGVSRRCRGAHRGGFDQAAATAQRLGAHPSVLTIHDWGHAADGRPWIVTDPQPAESRRHAAHAGRARSTSSGRSRSGVLLAGALETAHRAGIVHGDLSARPAGVRHRTASR